MIAVGRRRKCRITSKAASSSKAVIATIKVRPCFKTDAHGVLYVINNINFSLCKGQKEIFTHGIMATWILPSARTATMRRIHHRRPSYTYLMRVHSGMLFRSFLCHYLTTLITYFCENLFFVLLVCSSLR